MREDWQELAAALVALFRISTLMTDLNERQEKFCQALVGGMSATQAYIQAGYSANNAVSCAARLRKQPPVAARLAALRAGNAQAGQTQRSDLLRNLDWVMERAKEKGALGDMIRAVTQYSKMCGYDAPEKFEARLEVARIERKIVKPAN